ncbi:MAG: Spy/CpxP family protein refolding chaperone [Deltaproteobacteria bacterium]
MKKMIIVLGLVAVLIVGTTYVSAQGPGYGPGPGRMGQGNRGHQKGLDLTPEQRTKLQELRRKFNDETAQLREALRANRLELRSLWTNPNADSETIMEKERGMRDPQDQMRDKMVQMRLKARSILTPEQFTQIGQGRGEGPNFGRGHRMGPGGMNGRGGKMGYGQGAGRCGGM